MTWTCLLAWGVYFAPPVGATVLVLAVLVAAVRDVRRRGWRVVGREGRETAMLMLLMLAVLAVGAGVVSGGVVAFQWAERIVSTCPEGR